MSKIKKISVSNLKAVSALTADFNGMTCIITGGNNKGKSSFLKSLPERIRGTKPDMVLKHGEKEGFAEMELTTGEKFVWSFDNKKEKLTFISERNIPQSVTKDLCRVYFPPVFDVDEFLNSAPAKQKAILQKITGIDFSEFDRVYKNAYDERTFINKRVAEEKAKLVLVDPDLPAEPIELTELEKEYNGIEAHNLKFETVVKGISEKNTQITEVTNEIIELEERIERLNEKRNALHDEIIKGKTWCQDEKNKRKDNADQLAAKITEARKTNAGITANNAAKKQNETFKKLVAEAEQCEKRMKELNQEKVEVIQNASMPDGFGFSEDGITYNGFAFNKESLSSSAIYIGALKLAAANLGEVKTLHFDASFLDKNSLAEIERWANENHLQLLIERPDFEGGEIEYTIVSDATVTEKQKAVLN